MTSLRFFSAFLKILKRILHNLLKILQGFLCTTYMVICVANLNIEPHISVYLSQKGTHMSAVRYKHVGSDVFVLCFIFRTFYLFVVRWANNIIHKHSLDYVFEGLCIVYYIIVLKISDPIQNIRSTNGILIIICSHMTY